MAKGIKMGAKVHVLRGSFAARSGVVQWSEGTGRSRKWVVVLGSGVLETFAPFGFPFIQLNLLGSQ